MLLDKLAFGNRQSVPQQKILQRVMMEDVKNVEFIFAMNFKVVAQSITAQTVECLTCPDKAVERLAWMQESFRLQTADGFDGVQLNEGVEFFEFAQGLCGKSHLKHSSPLWLGAVKPASPAFRTIP
jgi:hypothetical protein